MRLSDSWYYGTFTLIHTEVSSLEVNVLYFMRSVTLITVEFAINDQAALFDVG